MTLTSSRISDEFKLVQEILAKSPGFGKSFQLYPNLHVAVYNNGYVEWYQERLVRNPGFDDPEALFEAEFEVDIVDAGCDTTRDFARYILRRYW